MVAVLSSKTVRTSFALCSASASLYRMPIDAARPVAAMTATGVASPSAQGHEITSTLIAILKTCGTVTATAPVPHRIIHTAKVSAAMQRTTGTKMPAILSTVFSIGALEEPASRTIFMIRERTVSSPTFSARMRSTLPLLTEALVTKSPSPTSTGRLSPVMADLSTKELPERTMPSTGILSPCFTMTTSPFTTSERRTVFCVPSRSTFTASGASFRSFSTSSPVLLLERASSHFPSVTSVSTIAADSKNKLFMASSCASA